MNVKEIIIKYLKKNGYEGLFCECCSCTIDDLIPCDLSIEDCKAGHKIPCDPETCKAGGSCEFHISYK